MPKIIWMVLAVPIMLGVFAWLNNRASQDANLKESIDSAFAAGEKEIDLRQMTDFDWERVDVFGPYTTDDVIEERMQVRFKGDNGGIDLLDDRFLLVFANEKRAVKTVVLSRKYGDYAIQEGHKLLLQ